MATTRDQDIIFLVGFMGTGKTSVGKAVAKVKGWEFIDLDQMIETREKRPISDIFTADGEAYFRRLEKQVLKQVAAAKQAVVSCGGGIVIDPENIRVMKNSGRVICLAASPQTILSRVKGMKNRPLLDVDNPEEKINALLRARVSYYAQADITIDTSGLSVEQVVQQLISLLDD